MRIGGVDVRERGLMGRGGGQRQQFVYLHLTHNIYDKHEDKERDEHCVQLFNERFGIASHIYVYVLIK